MKYFMLIVLFFGIQTSLFCAGNDERQLTLYDAVKNNDKSSVELIINEGINLNYRYHQGATGVTILHVSIIFQCDLAIIKLLITPDNINAHNYQRESPLSLAIFSPHSIDLTRLLVQHGANPKILAPGKESSSTTTLVWVEQMLGEQPNSQTLNEILAILQDASNIRRAYLTKQQIENPELKNLLN